VQAAIAANIFAIRGVAETKELSEMLPGILNQLGPDSLNSLRKLAQSYGGAYETSLFSSSVVCFLNCWHRLLLLFCLDVALLLMGSLLFPLMLFSALMLFLR
jgi:hypothetical protein